MSPSTTHSQPLADQQSPVREHSGDRGGHTPGPWTYRAHFQTDDEIAELKKLDLSPVRRLTNEGQAFVMSEDSRVALVDCQTEFKRGKGYQTDCAERDANARLIAAAPQLFVVADHPVLEWLLTDGLQHIPEPQRTSVNLFLIPLRNAAIAAAVGDRPAVPDTGAA